MSGQKHHQTHFQGTEVAFDPFLADIMLSKVFSIACIVSLLRGCTGDPHKRVIGTTETGVDYFESVACKAEYEAGLAPECRTDACGRRVVDGLFSDSDIHILHGIVSKGMRHRNNSGGPTILDINTGYIRDTNGLDNLFLKKIDVFSDDDFAHYGRIISKLKQTVADTFKISQLYFTAPTFITRLDGDIPWNPQEMHDEYWHPHADHNNTAHYHYSGLLYMSTYGEHFTGGRFKFIDSNFELFSTQPADGSLSLATPTEQDVQLEVQPRTGRAVIFTAGHENTHLVERLQSGQRFVLSFWFTCDPKREFEIFLDGKAHTTFSHKMREAHMRRQTAAQAKASGSSEL